MYNQGPFADWVPKPLMLLLIIIFLFPVLAVMGVYTGSTTSIAGGLGTYTEFISLANNATTIGMAIAITIALRIKMRFRSKEIIATSAIILAVVSILIATTQNPLVVVFGSFLIGFFKMFPIIEMVLPVMFILSPSGDKGQFYAIFYPLTIGNGLFASYLMTKITWNSSWEAPYFIMAALMLLIAALSLIFQHNKRFCFKKPLYQIDWLSLGLLTISAMFVNVGLVFMKQQAWFDSPLIVNSLIIGIVLMVVVIYRQRFLKRKLIDFSLIFKKSNLWHSLILLLFLGIYLASSSIFVQFTVGALDYNNLITDQLNLWMIPGIVIGGIYAYFSFKKNWHLKYYIAAGFVAFFIHSLLLYLMIQPQMNIEMLYVPMFIKGIGMGILYIGIWFYASIDLEMDELLGIIGILLLVRNFLGIALGGSIIGWASYYGQWDSLNNMVMHLDMNAFENGMSMYGPMQINAVLAASKKILGTLCWLSIPALIIVLTHHYGRFNYRRLILFRKVIRGNSIKGYRLGNSN